MDELAIPPSDIDPYEVIIGELIDDDADPIDEGPGPCRGDGAPCDDYRCCISS